MKIKALVEIRFDALSETDALSRIFQILEGDRPRVTATVLRLMEIKEEKPPSRG
jgi:hypothetical protein